MFLSIASACSFFLMVCGGVSFFEMDVGRVVLLSRTLCRCSDAAFLT